MSLATIRKIMETRLAAMSPALATAYENAAYSPVPGTPYQAAYLLPAEPDNREIGPGYTERGLFQVNLFYPKDAGAKDALARAEAIRAWFPFAGSYADGSVTVNILATPEIGAARADDDHFMVPVKVRWHARIQGG